jgi:hypothetical protein
MLIFLEVLNYDASREIPVFIFFKGRDHALVHIGLIYTYIVFHIRSGELSNAYRLPYRSNIAYIQRKRESVRAIADDNFQCAVRHYILYVCLLRGNADLFGHDGADGGFRTCFMAEKSV